MKVAWSSLSAVVTSFVAAVSILGSGESFAISELPHSSIISVESDDHPGIVERGATPAPFSSVTDQGITDVLIFKRSTGDEVVQEIEELKALGLASSRITHVPMPWKSFQDYQTPCEYVIHSLQVLENVAKTPGRKILFHCTVGEDRTGMLAGLFRMVDQGWSLEKAFQEEMCAKGYEAGNPEKPLNVNLAIRQALTPLFLKLAYFAESGQLKSDQISFDLCQKDPALDPTAAALFGPGGRYYAPQYTCE